MAGATIIFCDIVGFSKHSNDEQRALIYSLNAEVTHELYPYLSDLKPLPSVISLPTGDGMAIALLDKDHEQTSWRTELFSLLCRLIHWTKQNQKLRIGIHTGPVSVISDINRRPNICGATINMAQRVMDAANPNQVLFSESAHREIVGLQSRQFSNAPFSDEHPAQFKGPYKIIAKHGLDMQVYVMFRSGDSSWQMIEPSPQGTILGKLPRTKFIGDQLERCLNENVPGLTIYEQSAFSTFGVSPDETLWKAGTEYSKDYYEACLRQRRLLEELAKRENTILKLIVAPVRAYTSDQMCARLTTLIDWMSQPDILGNDTVDFVNARYEGPNRLIVKGQFSIEGFKLHDTSGYELTIVQRDTQRVKEATDSFERIFASAKRQRAEKQSVIDEMEKLRSSYSSKKRGQR